MKSWLSLFLAIMVAGYSTAAPDPAAQLCGAATLLADARFVAAKALLIEQTGQPAAAQDLAGQARATAEQANAGLQAVSADAQRSATWQALSRAYVHLGQATTALRSASANPDRVPTSELTAVEAQFAIARTALPERCFAVGVNQPDSPDL